METLKQSYDAEGRNDDNRRGTPMTRRRSRGSTSGDFIGGHGLQLICRGKSALAQKQSVCLKNTAKQKPAHLIVPPTETIRPIKPLAVRMVGR